MRESVPVPLLVLESCIVDNIDCSEILANIPNDVLVKWESNSPILKEGLTKMNWWKQSYPTCFERLSFGNWRELLCKSDHRVWKESLGSVRYALRYDELGSDEKIHQLVSSHVLRTFVWRNDSETQSYVDFQSDRVLQMWSVPFQDSCLVWLENQDLLLVCGKQSKLLHRTEKPIKFATISNGTCFSVVIEGEGVLLFDEKKNHMIESSNVTACCFVLDSLLLLASNDGVIRAHPKNNPKSAYFVEDLDSYIFQMTSLSNVVAIIHSYSILEVRHVCKIEEDPFIRFNVLYRYKGADCDHPPLLYGPFVIFAGLDGIWYRVLYDGFTNPSQSREELKMPHGWKIVSVKNANWKYLTIVTKTEEVLLFF
jgi:hypothetical protein